MAYRHLGNHQDAEEVTQDTFINAFRGIATFRGDSAFFNVALQDRHQPGAEQEAVLVGEEAGLNALAGFPFEATPMRRRSASSYPRRTSRRTTS